MLMSWAEAAEMLNLFHNKETKKKKKGFNLNLSLESLAGVMGMSVAASPGLQAWLQDDGGIFTPPPEPFSWVNLTGSIKSIPLAPGC